MFLYVYKHTFRIRKKHISQRVKGVIMCNLCDTIFYTKMNIWQEFHICISVPLIYLVTQGSDYIWIYLNNSQIWLIVSEYVRICRNMPKSVWMVSVFHVSFLIPSLLLILTKFIVWRNMRLLSWRKKTWFFYSS